MFVFDVKRYVVSKPQSPCKTIRKLPFFAT